MLGAFSGDLVHLAHRWRDNLLPRELFPKALEVPHRLHRIIGLAALGTSLGLHGYHQVVVTDFDFGLDRSLYHFAALTDYTFHKPLLCLKFASHRAGSGW